MCPIIEALSLLSDGPGKDVRPLVFREEQRIVSRDAWLVIGDGALAPGRNVVPLPADEK